ncbi:MAG: signal peptide peptidase SppA [Cardiobacteriaceae bacterium]|nr:signal peptide peptidase SppA [Cardiobacteriaceae bacterium]
MTHDEERALAQVAHEAIKELRARRRWKIFFRFLFVGLFAAYVLYIVNATRQKEPAQANAQHVAVVQVHGEIGAQDYANAADVIESLEDAFAHPQALAVFLDINSPGGSPVQSAQVYRAINRLKEKHKKPIYAVISDVGASGAYYIAAAADEIHADAASLVGSIGVISQSYGVGDLLGKIGVEARTFTSGESKDFLNMAKPLREEDVAHMNAMLDNVHQQFIRAVKEGRKDALKYEEHPEVFSGLFWSGEQALELGLIDGLADMRELALAKAGTAVLRVYEPHLSPWETLRRNLASESGAALRQFLGVHQKVDAVLAK